MFLSMIFNLLTYLKGKKKVFNMDQQFLKKFLTFYILILSN